jgi:hypothetical protein
MIIAVLVTFFCLMLADSLREFPFNSQSRKKRKEGTKELQWPGTKIYVYKRRIKTRQTGFLFDSLLLLSFYTLS